MGEKTIASNSTLRTLLRRLETAIQPLYVHLTGQSLAWYTIATHDLSKWESAVAVAGTAALTVAIAKVKTWLH